MGVKLPHMISKLICFFRGHKRGKRVDSQDNGKLKVFACPRCGRRTEYKAKLDG